MNYFYCPRPDEAVKDLAASLKVQLITSFDGLNFWFKRDRVKIGAGDTLICWGETLPKLDGVRMLNGCDNPINDLNAIHKLRVEIGWSSIRVEKPESLSSFKAKAAGWLPRSFKHHSGDDLLFKPNKVDFWIKQSDFTSQWRCHVLNKKMVRCGIKALKPNTTVVNQYEWKPGIGLAHPWVKSELGGWTLDYSEPKPSSTLKEFAVGVCGALGLDLCTVDIGQAPTGDLTLIGVNYAPDLPDKKCVEGYVLRLERWIKGVNDDEAKSKKSAKVVSF